MNNYTILMSHYLLNAEKQTQSKIILHFYITDFLRITAICQNKQFFYAYFAVITPSSN